MDGFKISLESSKKNHAFGVGGYINPINDVQVNDLHILKTSVFMVLFLRNALSDEVFCVLNIKVVWDITPCRLVNIFTKATRLEIPEDM